MNRAPFILGYLILVPNMVFAGPLEVNFEAAATFYLVLMGCVVTGTAVLAAWDIYVNKNYKLWVLVFALVLFLYLF